MQSFAAGEVTPELAHQIAKELADRVLGGQYEYVIGTHLNTGHIHSHIVWNSVSCVDGKKYRSNYKSYVTEIRAVSDELCRKYKLSVIDTENSNHVAKPYAEWLAEKNNQPTWRTAIRQDVDDAIRQSLTWRQFVAALQNKGYELQFNRKYPVLRPPGKERFVRFKTLGKRYTAEVIQNRLLYPQFDRCFVENSPRVQYGRLHSGKKSRRKLTGLRALYYRYLYELGALPRKPSRSSYAVRQDAYKLDQRIRQMEFLSRNNIDTLTQLETHRQALQTEIRQLLTKRKQLPKTDDVGKTHHAGKKEPLVGLAAAPATCVVGGAGGGLPLAAGHENNGSAGCAEQRTGRAVCVGVGQQQPALFAGVHGDLRGSGYCSRDRSEEHPPRCGAWLGGLG